MRNTLETLMSQPRKPLDVGLQLNLDQKYPFNTASKQEPVTKEVRERAATVLHYAVKLNLGDHYPKKSNENLLNGQVKQEAMPQDVNIDINAVPDATIQENVPEHTTVSDFFSQFGTEKGLKLLGRYDNSPTKPNILRYDNGPTLRVFKKIDIVSFIGPQHMRTVQDQALRVLEEGTNGVYQQYDLISPITVDPRDGSIAVSVINVEGNNASVRSINVEEVDAEGTPEGDKEAVLIAYLLDPENKSPKSKLLTDDEELQLRRQVENTERKKNKQPELAPLTLVEGGKVLVGGDNHYAKNLNPVSRKGTYPHGW